MQGSGGSNQKRVFISSLFFLLFSVLCNPVFAEEQITITTYYPAPYGIYREIRSNFIAVGSAYRATAATTTDGGTQDGDAWFAGQVGIGTTSPSNLLSVKNYFTVGGEGDIDVTGGADGKFAFFKNSVEKIAFDSIGNLSLVSGGGNVGIGTTTPATPLHVRASANSNFLVGSGSVAFIFGDPSGATDEVKIYAADSTGALTNMNLVANNIKLYGNANVCVRKSYTSTSGTTACPTGYMLTFDPQTIPSPPLSGFFVCCKYCSGVSTCP